MLRRDALSTLHRAKSCLGKWLSFRRQTQRRCEKIASKNTMLDWQHASDDDDGPGKGSDGSIG